LVTVLVLVVGSVRNAQAAFDGSELEQMLGWLCVVPIGLLQLFLAFAVRKHVAGNLVARTLLATAISLAAGFFATLAFVGQRALVPALAIVMLGPGAPTFVSLMRTRVVAVGMVLFLLPPLPFIYWLGEKAW
jgi:hypothetical protein